MKREVNRALTQISKKISDRSLRFFKENYRKQGFWDRSFRKWKSRKDSKPHPILYKSGKLFRSIRVKSRSAFKIIISSDTAYGSFHNKGTQKLPKRQFLGNSAELTRQHLKIIDKEMKKLFRRK